MGGGGEAGRGATTRQRPARRRRRDVREASRLRSEHSAEFKVVLRREADVANKADDRTRHEVAGGSKIR